MDFSVDRCLHGRHRDGGVCVTGAPGAAAASEWAHRLGRPCCLAHFRDSGDLSSVKNELGRHDGKGPGAVRFEGGQADADGRRRQGIGSLGGAWGRVRSLSRHPMPPVRRMGTRGKGVSVVARGGETREQRRQGRAGRQGLDGLEGRTGFPVAARTLPEGKDKSARKGCQDECRKCVNVGHKQHQCRAPCYVGECIADEAGVGVEGVRSIGQLHVHEFDEDSSVRSVGVVGLECGTPRVNSSSSAEQLSGPMSGDVLGKKRKAPGGSVRGPKSGFRM